MTTLTWSSRRLIIFETFLEILVTGTVSRDMYRGWKTCCIAGGGLEAKARARVVLLGRKSLNADMIC